MPAAMMALLLVLEVPTSRTAHSADAPLARRHACGSDAHDRDADGLDDSLEGVLAARFFPQLHMSPADEAVFYGGRAGAACADRDACRLPFVARPVRLDGVKACSDARARGGGCVEIAFALPYAFDLGAPAAFSLGGHPGDSEMFAVLVAGDRFALGARWRLVARFYAAHECARILGIDADHSQVRWNARSAITSSAAGTDLAANDAVPEVFVAVGKHGSYPSLAACELGGPLGLDRCEARILPRAAIVSRLVDVGEGDGRGTACDGYDSEVAFPSHDGKTLARGRYDVWSVASFGARTTPYATHLRPGAIDWERGEARCGWDPASTEP